LSAAIPRAYFGGMTHHDGLPGDHEIDSEETAAVAVTKSGTNAGTGTHAENDAVFPVDHGHGEQTDTDTAGEGGYVSSTDRGDESPVPHAGA
jgi:hypothetical protein